MAQMTLKEAAKMFAESAQALHAAGISYLYAAAHKEPEAFMAATQDFKDSFPTYEIRARDDSDYPLKLCVEVSGVCFNTIAKTSEIGWFDTYGAHFAQFTQESEE